MPEILTSLPERVAVQQPMSLQQWRKDIIAASRKVEQWEDWYTSLKTELDANPVLYERYSAMLLKCAVQLRNAQDALEAIQERFDPPANSEVTLTRT